MIVGEKKRPSVEVLWESHAPQGTVLKTLELGHGVPALQLSQQEQAPAVHFFFALLFLVVEVD